MVKAVLDNRGVAEGRFALVRGRSARTDGVVARGLSRSTPSGWRGRSGRLDAGRSSLPARQRPRTVCGPKAGLGRASWLTGCFNFDEIPVLLLKPS